MTSHVGRKSGQKALRPSTLNSVAIHEDLCRIPSPLLWDPIESVGYSTKSTGVRDVTSTGTPPPLWSCYLFAFTHRGTRTGGAPGYWLVSTATKATASTVPVPVGRLHRVHAYWYDTGSLLGWIDDSMAPQRYNGYRKDNELVSVIDDRIKK
jgi:hypothetical protein